MIIGWWSGIGLTVGLWWSGIGLTVDYRMVSGIGLTVDYKVVVWYWTNC